MNSTHDEMLNSKVALVTGGARRIGAMIVRTLHQRGFRVIVHYGGSRDDARSLVAALESKRNDSARQISADLRDTNAIAVLAEAATAQWGRLDVLVNNASTFHATPLGQCNPDQWEDLLAVNLKAPWFLVQALAGELRRRSGAIVNIVDIYAQRPLADFAPYCAAKAGLESLTRSLALELAPEVRVNAVAPGAILWPEADDDDDARDAIIKRTPLARLGDPRDIADAVAYFVDGQSFVTGQILNVDGGRSVVP
jgi:pteridine reductase